MAGMVSELRSVLRTLGKSPGFTLVSLLTLALGIGVNVAIFSLVNGILLRQLPYPDSQRLVMVSHSVTEYAFDDMDVSMPLYLKYSEVVDSFDGVAAFRQSRISLTGVEVPVRVYEATVTASLFPTLQVAPTLGRAFVEDDEKPGAPPVVLLSDGVWRERFGADPQVVGRHIELDGVKREVVGVMPARFEFPDPNVEIWLPMEMDPARALLGAFGTGCVARLKDGASLHGALAELERITTKLPEFFPDASAAAILVRAGFAPYLVPLLEDVVGDFQRNLWILLIAVGSVLLMACANVANLFLVRAEGRHRELAIRSALGASRSRLAGTFLLEGTVLALAGGVLSLGLAGLAIRGLVRLAPEGVPRLHEVGIDASVLLFTLLVSLTSALLFAFLPALQHGVPSLVASLKDGARGSSVGRGRWRTRHALVALQMALGLVLLIGAGLMVRSFRHLSQVEPGFDPHRALTLRLTLPGSTYDSPETTARFVDLALEALRRLPGVSEVAAASHLPLTGSASGSGYALEDFPRQSQDEPPPVFMVKQVSAGYHQTMGIPILEGRGIEAEDHRQRTAAVVINETIAKRFWPNQSAQGKRLRSGTPDPERWYTVVGVAGAVRDQTLQAEPMEMVYYPMVNLEGDGGLMSDVTFVLRTPGEPRALIDAVRSEIWALDPNLPISGVITLEEIVDRAKARMGFSMLLLLLASGLALALGGIGIYGVISHLVSQRTQEIGVRLALGAKGSTVRHMVVRDGLVVALIGIAVGLAGAFSLTRLMGALLFGVGPLDPLTFVSVPLVLMAVAFAASFVPALRASRVDPLVALRYE